MYIRFDIPFIPNMAKRRRKLNNEKLFKVSGRLLADAMAEHYNPMDDSME